MNSKKIGNLIYSLRKEQGLTQLMLANRLNISDKTVSKWERGLGCPDISIIPEISNIFGVDLQSFLSGELEKNDMIGDNMKKINFYVCKECQNIVWSTKDMQLSCCGKKLTPLTRQKPYDTEDLLVEPIENELFISSTHSMTKEHYISFIALITGDKVTIVKQYPEWNVQARLPYIKYATLVWYCTKDGLFSKILKLKSTNF